MRFSFGPRGCSPPPFGFNFGPGGPPPWGSPPGWDWGGGGSHRGGRGRRRLFEPGELRLVLLSLIAERARHGYDLIRAAEELSGGAYVPSPGVVYPTLTLLEDMGLIEESQGQGSRRIFQVTEEGRTELRQKKEEVEALLKRVADLKEDQPRMGAPIGRAVRNLMSALWQRASTGGLDEARAHDVAAILDEAAQKIERL